MNKLVAGAALGLMALGTVCSTPAPVSARTFAAATAAAVAPVSASEETDLGDRRYMFTSATLSNGGRIDATTRVWTRNKWTGFTGGVLVLFVDGGGHVIGGTEMRSFGVDGLYIPFKASNRTVYWMEGVDQGLVNRTASLKIVHVYAPRDRFYAIIGEARDKIKAAAEAGKDIAVVVAEIIRAAG